MRTVLVVVAGRGAFAAASADREDRHVPGVPQPGQSICSSPPPTAATSVRCSPRQTTDYDAAWSPDGESDRVHLGARRIRRSLSCESGRQRSRTADDSPAYDDQAAFSPAGKQLAFVTTRNRGTSDIWTLDLQSRRARALTSGPGGDFRPRGRRTARGSRSRRIARATCVRARRWEHLHLVDLYVVRPRRKRAEAGSPSTGISAAARNGPPTAAACSRTAMDASRRSTSPRRAGACGRHAARVDCVGPAPRPACRRAPAVKFKPVVSACGTTVGYVRKDAAGSGIFYSNGRAARRARFAPPPGSPDGTPRGLSQESGLHAKAVGQDLQRNPGYGADADRDAAVVPPIRRSLRDRRGSDRGNRRRRGGPARAATSRNVIFQDKTRNVLGRVVAARRHVIFGIGTFNAFFNGFHSLFPSLKIARQGGAQMR